MRSTLHLKQQSGFTLIEVLIALLVVSIGISSVIQVTTKHVSNISKLEKRMLASWVASNHIAEIRYEAKMDRIRSGSKAERVKLGGHQWRSKLEIEETDVKRVFLLKVEVSDDSNAQKKVFAKITSAVTDRL